RVLRGGARGGHRTEEPQRPATGAHPHLARPGTGERELMATPEVVVLPDAAALAAEVAARLVVALRAAQESRGGRAALGLTAGSIIEQVWTSLASSDDA